MNTIPSNTYVPPYGSIGEGNFETNGFADRSYEAGTGIGGVRRYTPYGGSACGGNGRYVSKYRQEGHGGQRGGDSDDGGNDSGEDSDDGANDGDEDEDGSDDGGNDSGEDSDDGGNDGDEDGDGSGLSEKRHHKEDAPEKDLFKTTYNPGTIVDKYDRITVEATGKDIPPPMETFDAMKLHSVLRKNAKRARYTKPTPVQKHAVPIVLADRDVMACAQTGSGKTAGFLFPIIQWLLKSNVKDDGVLNEKAYPSALILSPTRELTTQIYDEARKFTHNTPIKTAVVHGGSALHTQISDMQSGCHILVAAPGRLTHLIRRDVVSLYGIRFLVLDEADRMMDMGFMVQIRQIVEGTGMPPTGKRRTLLFSATFPSAIRQLAASFMSNYIFLAVGRVGSTTESIAQKIEKVLKRDKRKTLIERLQSEGTPRGRKLVFVNSQVAAGHLETFLKKKKIRVISIHGGKTQRKREDALDKFKRGERNVLVATDLAARGLDIKKVELVINYELPNNIDAYIHRIGRTGRAGKLGTAISFFNDDDSDLAKGLVKTLKETNTEVPEFLEEAKNRKRSKGRSGGGGRGGGGSGGRGRHGGYRR